MRSRASRWPRLTVHSRWMAAATSDSHHSAWVMRGCSSIISSNAVLLISEITTGVTAPIE